MCRPSMGTFRIDEQHRRGATDFRSSKELRTDTLVRARTGEQDAVKGLNEDTGLPSETAKRVRVWIMLICVLQ